VQNGNVASNARGVAGSGSAPNPGDDPFSPLDSWLWRQRCHPWVVAGLRRRYKFNEDSLSWQGLVVLPILATIAC